MAQESASSETGGVSSTSRSASFSRLNAQAPEFVPTRPTSRADRDRLQPRLVAPPPLPPPAGTSAFHLPIRPHMPVGGPHHHLSRQFPLHYHPHHHHYYAPTAGDQDSALPSLPIPNPQLEPHHKTPLPDEAALKILNQVEYYFSDLNLATTDHLMRFINKDPQGYVPISVIALFKKIKALISSHSQLATVLRNSSKLVVSEDGKKVRRLRPLTKSDIEELQSRIVVAENLPEDHCHQNLVKVFSTVGSVNSIRTCPPQSSNGGASSASRLAKVDGMPLSNKLHAFVEYESVELAERAVTELNDERNWRSGLRVRLMLRCMSKPAQVCGKKGLEVEVEYEQDYASVPEQQANEKLLEDSYLVDSKLHEPAGEEHNFEESGLRKVRSRGRGKGRGRSSHCYQFSRVNHIGTPPSNNSIPVEQVVAKQPPGPRMPDGTKGFSIGRGKPVAVVAVE